MDPSMTSQQKWIYDPPPPPPQKATVESTRMYGSQRPVRGGENRGYRGRGGRGRGVGAENGRALGGFSSRGARVGNSEASQGYGGQSRGYDSRRYQPSPTGGLQSYSGYPIPQQQQSWSNGLYPQTYPFQQPFYPNVAASQHQYPPPQPFYPPYPQLQIHTPAPYSQSTPRQQNAEGYTLSATAFSLPSHHYKPSPSSTDHPEMSEDELRYLLEQQMKTLKPGAPIEGTNVKLNSVEDIMEWREQRRKKWLSKIAAAERPKREERRRRNRVHTSMSKKMEDLRMKKEDGEVVSVDEGDLSEGEILEPKKRAHMGLTVSKDIDTLPSSPQQKEQNPKSGVIAKKHKICALWRKGKCHRGRKCPFLHSKRGPSKEASHTNKLITEEDDKPKSLYAVLLQSQMERENMIMLQALLHFREHGLLDLDLKVSG